MLYQHPSLLIIDNVCDRKLNIKLILKVAECTVLSMLPLHFSGSILGLWIGLPLLTPCCG
jgi:hypothetical protein